jgi:hypothetical protein
MATSAPQVAHHRCLRPLLRRPSRHNLTAAFAGMTRCVFLFPLSWKNASAASHAWSMFVDAPKYEQLLQASDESEGNEYVARVCILSVVRPPRTAAT